MDRSFIKLIAGMMLLPLLSATAWAGACSEIVIGSVISLTGKYSIGGLHTRNGYEFAVQQMNSAGGVQIGAKCYQLRVIYYDAESSPERATQLAGHLIEKDRVRYLLGSYSAEVTAAVAIVAERHKLPIISPQGTGNSLYWSEPRFHFGLLPADPDYLRPVLELAVKIARRVGRQPADLKVAVVVEDDPYFRDNGAGLRSYAQQLGSAVVVDGRLTEKSADNRALFARIKAASPDVLIVSAHTRLTQEAVRTISELEMQVPMVAMSDCEAADVTSIPGYAEKLVCVSRYASSTTSSKGVFGSAATFKDMFVTKFEDYARKQLPDEVGQAAAAVLVFAQAFQVAATLDAQRVRDAIAGTEMDTFVGRVKFAINGRNSPQKVMLRQIQDGRYKIVAPPDLATSRLQWPRAGL